MKSSGPGGRGAVSVSINEHCHETTTARTAKASSRQEDCTGGEGKTEISGKLRKTQIEQASDERSKVTTGIGYLFRTRHCFWKERLSPPLSPSKLSTDHVLNLLPRLKTTDWHSSAIAQSKPGTKSQPREPASRHRRSHSGRRSEAMKYPTFHLTLHRA